MTKSITKNISDIDNPDLVLTRRDILHKKKFLKKIYQEWYSLILSKLPVSGQPVLEIGSGAGFFKDYAKGKTIITSEILKTPAVDLVFDACKGIPLKDKSLSAIVMTDVLHHLPDIRRFFSESERVLCEGGKIIMIEPWVTAWSKFVYKNFHHEPFDIRSADWKFESRGPLSDANGALPWIIFNRDKNLFMKEYPNLLIGEIKLLMPFSYLFSGGFSYPGIIPVCLYTLLRSIEDYSSLLNHKSAMFALIELTSKINS